MHTICLPVRQRTLPQCLVRFLSAGVALGVPPMLFCLADGGGIKHHDDFDALCHRHLSCDFFGSGYTTLPEWWKAGFVMSVVNIIVFTLIGGLWWKVLGYW